MALLVYPGFFIPHIQKIQMILDDAVLFEQGYMIVKMSSAAPVWTSLDLNTFIFLKKQPVALR